MKNNDFFLDLGSSAERRESSSLSFRTILFTGISMLIPVFVWEKYLELPVLPASPSLRLFTSWRGVRVGSMKVVTTFVRLCAFLPMGNPGLY